MRVIQMIAYDYYTPTGISLQLFRITFKEEYINY